MKFVTPIELDLTLKMNGDAVKNLNKIPVTIITGFLGSGKTTLISHLMQNSSGKKLAVIVNEFGDLGVDGEILKNCADENCPLDNIMELSNGCICCTVADDFIPTMNQLLNLPTVPEHIIIETSGLALPKPLLKAFSWPDIKTKITVDGVIAVADAEAVDSGQFASDLAAINRQREADSSIEHDTPLSEVFEDQITCADIILLSKVDLVSEKQKDTAKNIILRLRKNVPVIDTVNGKVDNRLILGLDSKAEDDLMKRPSHHDGFDDHEHDDFDTFVLSLGDIDKLEEFERTLHQVLKSEAILRVKGYLSIKDKPMRLLVQAVGERVRTQYDKPWRDSKRTSKLVIIAEKDNLKENKIREQFSHFN